MGKYITGEARGQLVLFSESIEERISEENAVRVIDMYVESIKLEELGFKRVKPKNKGTNMYNPKDILKLYIYGYKNGIRSSRKLARECEKNIEVIWLMKGLRPDFRTISEFRKENIKELKNVYKDMVIMCTKIGIIGEEYSQDGVKINAVNSKERNYTLNKVDDQIKRIEKKIEEYLKKMEEMDAEEEKEEKLVSKEELEERIKIKKEKEEKLKRIRKELEEKEGSQKSLTDKDSRLMKNNGKFTMCYNNQVVVDGKSHIVVNYKVDNNPADIGSMKEVIKEAKETTGKEIVKNITDKGYNNRKDMGECLLEGIIPEVTLPEGKEYYEVEIEYEEGEITEETRKSKKVEEIRKTLKAGEIPEEYKEYIKDIEIVETKERIKKGTEEKEEIEANEEEERERAIEKEIFVRDIKRNKVFCPQGETLRQKSETKEGIKNYCNREACKGCKKPCTMSKYKVIGFGEGQKELGKGKTEKVKRRKKEIVKKVRFKLYPKKEDIKKRMGISEHPHGTMKRSDNASYFLMRGKEKVNGEMAIYYMGYNIRRIINIVGTKKILEILEKRIKGEQIEAIV